MTKADGFPSGVTVNLNDVGLSTVLSNQTTLIAKGYLAPWTTGKASFSLSAPSGWSTNVLVPVAAVAVPYDAAQRLAMQVAFGPRTDTIARIQQLGMAAYLKEQVSQPADVYPSPDAEQPQTHFLRLVGSGPAVLRQRTAWAFQTFIPESGFPNPSSMITWETTLERDAFGSFKQILLDAASVPIIGYQLNLTGNYASTDPNVHPNQNFARELMQLFSLGTVLLNEDGTPNLDASGKEQPVYDQDTVLAMSRVFTGWNLSTVIVHPDIVQGSYDFSQPLVADENYHDHGSKLLFGHVLLPAGQSAALDRDQALEAIFQHPNLPPFVCRILIQRFVKSQPSPAYVKRIVQVFKDNGTGVRGDLGSVLQAILLDPEARLEDTTSTLSDGFVQDPLFAQIVVMHLMNVVLYDDTPIYHPRDLGEPWWRSPSVFSYFRPSYVVPGTSINSPESQLLDDIRIVQRSQFIWTVLTQNGLGSIAGFGTNPIYLQFPTLTSLTEALNHELYHGAMPQHVKDAIASYCGGISDHTLQLQSAVFIALSSDYYTVTQ